MQRYGLRALAVCRMQAGLLDSAVQLPVPGMVDRLDWVKLLGSRMAGITVPSSTIHHMAHNTDGCVACCCL